MLLLTTVSDEIRVVTDTACTVSAHASYVDYSEGNTAVPGRTNTSITTATTTVVVNPPAGSTVRNLKSLIIKNNHSTNLVVVTIIHTDGSTQVTLFKESIGPNGVVNYYDNQGFKVETGSAVIETWDSNIYWAYGRCDPQQGLRMAQMMGTVAATPTNISTTVARIAYFRPPANITVNRIRYYGTGATTNLYQVAIYNGDTLVRLTDQLTSTTVAATWGAFGSSLGLNLIADQLYFAAVGASAVNTTAGMLCVSPSTAATTGTIGVFPKSWQGNLDLDLGYMDGGFAQFAVSGGALPDPAALIAVQAAWTGGFPLLLLDNDNT